MSNYYITIIQDRMGSSRFPGKAQLPIWNNISSLELLIRRLDTIYDYRCSGKTVVAIPISEKNNILEENVYKISNKNNIRPVHCYRGDENNVLKRVADAAKKHSVIDGIKTNCIIDITSDCPFVDPSMVINMIEEFEQHSYDYYSNVVTRSYADGMDVQIYKAKLLYILDSFCIPSEQHKSHVGWNILNYCSKINKRLSYPIKIGHHVADDYEFRPDIGITLDTEKDYELLKAIMKELDCIHFGYYDILALLEEKPELLKINSKVKRNIPGIG